MAADLPPLEYEEPPAEPVRTKNGRLVVTRDPATKKQFSAPMTAPGGAGATAADIGLASLSGLAEGTSDLLGLPATVTAHGEDATNWTLAQLSRFVPGIKTMTPDEVAQNREKNAVGYNVISPETAKSIGENYGPEAFYQAQPFRHEAQTLPGQYAHTVASFLPALAAPEARIPRTLADLKKLAGTAPILAPKKVAAYGVAPGVAAETAGQVTDDNPWARAVVGGATGVAGALATAPSKVDRLAKAALGNTTEAQIKAAEQIFEESQRQGMNMTWPEAIQHATGGATNLTNLQRYVEGTGGLQEFYAQRPGQVEAAAQHQFNQLGPPNMEPSMLGPTTESVARQAVEQGTPQGQALQGAVSQAGPRVTAEEAGNVIQPSLARTRAGLDQARGNQADIEYAAARNAEPTVPIDESRTQNIVRYEPTPEPWPVGRDPKTGQGYRKSEQQIEVEALRQPAPVEPPRENGRWVKMDPDEVAAQKAANVEAMQQAQQQRFQQTHRVEENVPVVGGPTRFVQVNPSAAAGRLEQAITGGEAKEAGTSYLERARGLLNDSQGNLDTSVTGLLSARDGIGDLIGEAERAGHGNSARLLKDAQKMLDQTLETQSPMAGQARRNYQTNSRPLDVFEQEGRVPGQITEPAPGPPGSGADFQPGAIPGASAAAQAAAHAQSQQRFAMPPEQVPGAITGGGPSAVRDFRQATQDPAAEHAYEQRFVTEVLDKAGRNGVDVNSKSIRDALLEHEDTLKQLPGVRQKLEAVADQREGLENVLKGTPLGKLVGKPDVEHVFDTLFERNPGANTEQEITNALTQLNNRSPKLTRDVVSNYLQTRFNQYARSLQAGPNQYGGAGYAAGIMGNSQQAKNLQAAMRVAYGDDVTNGFMKFMEVLQAQGQRQRVGSPTAFYQEIRQQLEGGGFGEAAVLGALGMATEGASTAGTAAGVIGMFKGVDRAKKTINQMGRENKLGALTDLFTNKMAAQEWSNLARAPPGSQRARDVFKRLAFIVNTAGTKASAPPPE